MEESRQEPLICDCCGSEIEPGEDYTYVGEDVVCQACAEDECGRCEHCGDLIYADNSVSDDSHFLCQRCYDEHYTRCECCDRIISNSNAYYNNDFDYCFECYDKQSHTIREYSYKPEPIFYGEGKRHFGVELEVDNGGHDDENAETLLDAINTTNELIYIKSDGSLNDGFEIVTHPATIDYHMNSFPWDDLTDCLIHMGYRSHQTATCGLHVHVSRAGLGETFEDQEATVSRILFFVESHWAELLKFSRRSEYSMNRWAARHGYDQDPKRLLNKAKSDRNRYTAVNLCNASTVEFRLFRGTLKLNTLLATLQLVNRICDTAVQLTDSELQALSWSEFVSRIEEPELVQYLKERRLYVNDIITNEEEL